MSLSDNNFYKSNSSPLGLLIWSDYDSARHCFDASALLVQSDSEIIPAHLSRAPLPLHKENRSHHSDPTRGQGFRATRFFSHAPRIAEGLLILPSVFLFLFFFV